MVFLNMSVPPCICLPTHGKNFCFETAPTCRKGFGLLYYFKAVSYTHLYSFDLPESIAATVKSGSVVGTATVYLDGDEVGTVDLVTHREYVSCLLYTSPLQPPDSCIPRPC